MSSQFLGKSKSVTYTTEVVHTRNSQSMTHSLYEIS